MKYLIAFAMIGAIASMALVNSPVWSTQSADQTEFANFIAKYKKSYASNDEFTMRFAIFQNNLREVERLNAKKTHATFGTHIFSDQTVEEVAATRTGLLPREDSNDADVEFSTYNVNNAPSSIDWIAKGFVLPVKNQGACGSCWAFSAIATYEAMYKQHESCSVLDWSEQQLVDCSGSFGNMGCRGGWMDWAYNYMATVNECQQTDYKYTARDETCKDSKCAKKNFVLGHVIVPKGRDAHVAAAAEHVVSIALSAGNSVFMNYKSGVITDADNCPQRMDHAVNIVGYDTNSDGIEYFHIRNSWGAAWGDKGYLKIATTSAKYPNTGICTMFFKTSFPKLS